MTESSPRISRRSCFLASLLLLIVLIMAGLFTFAEIPPNFGAKPQGVAHGNNQAQIAAAIASDAALQLVAGKHAVIIISEKDLTTLLAARIQGLPNFRNPEVRIRGGELVVSVTTNAGPFSMTPSVYLQMKFDAGSAQISVMPTKYEIGSLPVPFWVISRFTTIRPLIINLNQLFNTNVALGVIAESMECMAVSPDGIHLAFRRPGSTPDSTLCSKPYFPLSA